MAQMKTRRIQPKLLQKGSLMDVLTDEPDNGIVFTTVPMVTTQATQPARGSEDIQRLYGEVKHKNDELERVGEELEHKNDELERKDEEFGGLRQQAIEVKNKWEETQKNARELLTTQNNKLQEANNKLQEAEKVARDNVDEMGQLRWRIVVLTETLADRDKEIEKLRARVELERQNAANCEKNKTESLNSERALQAHLKDFERKLSECEDQLVLYDFTENVDGQQQQERIKKARQTITDLKAALENCKAERLKQGPEQKEFSQLKLELNKCHTLIAEYEIKLGECLAAHQLDTNRILKLEEDLKKYREWQSEWIPEAKTELLKSGAMDPSHAHELGAELKKLRDEEEDEKKQSLSDLAPVNVLVPEAKVNPVDLSAPPPPINSAAAEPQMDSSLRAEPKKTDSSLLPPRATEAKQPKMGSSVRAVRAVRAVQAESNVIEKESPAKKLFIQALRKRARVGVYQESYAELIRSLAEIRKTDPDTQKYINIVNMLKILDGVSSNLSPRVAKDDVDAFTFIRQFVNENNVDNLKEHADKWLEFTKRGVFLKQQADYTEAKKTFGAALFDVFKNVRDDVQRLQRSTVINYLKSLADQMLRNEIGLGQSEKTQDVLDYIWDLEHIDPPKGSPRYYQDRLQALTHIKQFVSDNKNNLVSIREVVDNSLAKATKLADADARAPQRARTVQKCLKL